jgi:hypothetical protein
MMVTTVSVMPCYCHLHKIVAEEQKHAPEVIHAERAAGQAPATI